MKLTYHTMLEDDNLIRHRSGRPFSHADTGCGHTAVYTAPVASVAYQVILDPGI